MTDSGQQNHLVPQTLWEKLYLGWFLVCFLMVWVGTWAVNEPVAVMGLPLVYAWVEARRRRRFTSRKQ